MKKILTVPSVIQDRGRYYLTGNHYVSLPRISPEGEIQNIAFLSGRLRALEEFKGRVSPWIRVDGAEGVFSRAGYEHDFIPSFSGGCGPVSYSLSYIAPETARGFIAVFSCKARADASVEAGFDVAIQSVMRSIFHSYALEGRVNLFHYAWTDTLICECISGGSLGGFGICCDSPEITVEGETARIRTGVRLRAGEEKELLFYFSVASETDGIALTGMDMRRRGASPAAEQAALLDQRHVELPDKLLERYANFNMNFCLYFSCGYTLDTGEMCLVTSKSTAYYVSSAFWSRDCFLWAFPAILRADPALARKALLCGFTKYAGNIGIHALYIDGQVLYPGFELDEQAAPVIALKQYVEATGDRDFMGLKAVQEGLQTIQSGLLARYDGESGLLSTELDSSDDPVTLRFNTYGNALCSVALDFLGERELASRIKSAVYAGCTVQWEDKRVFAYSSEGEERRLYDNPPGSLALLTYYGFTDREDALWRNTMEYIYSPANPYFYRQGRLLGTGCEHTPYPWTASLINRLLGGGEAAPDVLDALRLVAERCPLACESFDLRDGGLNTGDAFATMAGFIAHGIFTAFHR